MNSATSQILSIEAEPRNIDKTRIVEMTDTERIVGLLIEKADWYAIKFHLIIYDIK